MADPADPTREELIEAYTDLGDHELLEHAHAVNEAMARRRAQQQAMPYPSMYPMPIIVVGTKGFIVPADHGHVDTSFLGETHVGLRCTCGTQAIGGKCDDWCDLVKP